MTEISMLKAEFLLTQNGKNDKTTMKEQPSIKPWRATNKSIPKVNLHETIVKYWSKQFNPGWMKEKTARIT